MNTLVMCVKVMNRTDWKNKIKNADIMSAYIYNKVREEYITLFVKEKLKFEETL